MYKVTNALFDEGGKEQRREYILEDEEGLVYPLIPNGFLRKHSMNSIQTGKQYAYKLAQYLNYLLVFKEKNYLEATDEDIIDFFYAYSTSSTSKEMIRKRAGEKVISISNYRKSISSVQLMETVLVGFYLYARGRGKEIKITIYEREMPNTKSYFHGQTWSKKAYAFADTGELRKREKRTHIKWYSPEEIDCIMSGFQTIRDKAIFSFLLEGMRIDEVLSLRYQDYHENEGYVELYRSKGRITGAVDRTVQLSNRSIKLVNDYIETERYEVIRIKLKNKESLPHNLFINLRKGAFLGAEVSYRNYLDILKRAGSKAGFSKDEIRTHSGRSTHTMELLHARQDNPEITYDMIQQIMGWRSADSIQPYINKQDKQIAKKISEKLKRGKYDV